MAGRSNEHGEQQGAIKNPPSLLASLGQANSAGRKRGTEYGSAIRRHELIKNPANAAISETDFGKMASAELEFAA